MSTLQAELKTVKPSFLVADVMFNFCKGRQAVKLDRQRERMYDL